MCLAMSNKKRHALEECRTGTKVYLRPGLSLETDLGDGGSDSPGERSLAGSSSYANRRASTSDL